MSLLSNKLSTPFFEFEGKGNINHDTALALNTLHDPSQNNTIYNPQHLQFIKQITHHLMFLHWSIKQMLFTAKVTNKLYNTMTKL